MHCLLPHDLHCFVVWLCEGCVDCLGSVVLLDVVSGLLIYDVCCVIWFRDGARGNMLFSYCVVSRALNICDVMFTDMSCDVYGSCDVL